MSRVEAVYDYTDEHGKPRLRKVRRANKTFRMQAARFRHDRLYWKKEPGAVERWQPVWAPRALYQLPVILDAIKHSEPVFLVEGERDANTMTSLWQLPATTGWQGASEFTPEQAEWFKLGKGRSQVNVFMDNDDPGHFAGWRRYQRLIDAGVRRKRIRLYRPSSAAHKDPTDVALAGLGGSAFTRVGLGEVEERAAQYDAENARRYGYPPPGRGVAR